MTAARARDDGTSTLFTLVRLLEERQVYFTLARTRPDTIRIDAVSVAERLKIDVLQADHIEASRFRGNEEVEGEWTELITVLDAHR